jgi:two-component system NtrC family sensor kinase
MSGVNPVYKIFSPGIRTKILLFTLGTTGLLIGYFGWFSVNDEKNALAEELDVRANALTNNLARNCEYGLLTGNKDALIKLAESIIKEKSVYMVEIMNKEKLLSKQSGNDIEGPYKKFTAAVFTETARSEPDELFVIGGYGKNIRIGSVTVIFSLAEMNKKMMGLSRAVLLMSVVAFSIMSIFMIFMIERYILYPVKELVYATKRISKGDFDYRVRPVSNDEFRNLSDYFNTMAEKLKISRKEIEEYNRTLEAKVNERTAELMESKAQLLQSGKLAAIGQMAGGLAHEINNPISVILGFAQLLAKNVKEGEYNYIPLKSIEREAFRCKSLVTDLLTFSRSDKTKKECFSINEIIEHTVSLIEAQAKVMYINLEKDYGVNIPKLCGNKQQIQQILINLCNNAVDAMAKGGELLIRTRCIDVPGIAGRQLEITIADTGEGIPENIQKHIFEPFFTTKEVGRGTGLGLSLCYGIVQKHGGTISFESPRKDVNKGTAFYVILPFVAQGNE